MKNILSGFVCALALTGCCIAEEQTPNPARPDRPERQRPDGNDNRGGGPGQGIPGMGGPGMGGPPGNMNFIMGGRGAGDPAGMASRMLGINSDELKREANLEQLPLAGSRRFITRIPVGGIDNYDVTSGGWKMEGVFKLNTDQLKTVDVLRDEYRAEQKKLSQEIYEEELKLAQKVADLRVKYEKKANEILTGADKEAKEKLDALSFDIQTKNIDTIAQAAALYEFADLMQNFPVLNSLREKSVALYQSGADKLKETVPAGVRATVEDMLKKQTEERQNPMMQRGGFGGQGGQGGQGGDGGPGGGGFGGRGGRGGRGGGPGGPGGPGGDEPTTPPKATDKDVF